MPDAAVLLRTGLAILIFLQAGLWLLSLQHDDDAPLSRPETLSLAFGLGVGAITFQLLLMGIAGIRFRLLLVLAPWAVAWTIVLFATRGRLTRVLRDARSRVVETPTGRTEAAEALLLCLPVAVVLLVFAHALLFPISGWDEWMIWDLKARAFWIDGGIRPFVGAGYYALSHLDYPLLFPLAGTLLYLVLGEPHHIVQVIPATFFLCTLLQYAAGLRRFGASRLLTVALTGGLACLPPLLSSGMAFMSESASVYYILASTIWLTLYVRHGHRRFLWIAALTAGLTTQVRAEGLLVFAAPWALLVLRAFTTRPAADRRRAWADALLYAGVIAALFLPWIAASRALTAPEGRMLSSGSLGGLLINAGTIPHVFGLLARWAISPHHLGPFVLLVPLAAGLIVWRWRQMVGEWASACLLISAVWAPVPYLAFFVARPDALHIDAMGRYLGATLALLYTWVASQLIVMDGRFRRAVLTTAGVSLAVWMTADLFGGIGPSFYHMRPVQAARLLAEQGQPLARLTPLQQLQWLELKNQGMALAEMLPALLARPLPPGDVILFMSPGSTWGMPGSYLHGQLLYLLYPHRVLYVDDPAALAAALATAPAALIVYAQSPALDRVAGEVAFTFSGRYTVIRAPRIRPG